MRNVLGTIVAVLMTRAMWWLLGAGATLATLWMLASGGETDGKG